jgi:hypothetical protein
MYKLQLTDENRFLPCDPLIIFETVAFAVFRLLLAVHVLVRQEKAV